jgi:VCBS repeat-containing protein
MNGFKKRLTRILVVLMLMFYHVPVLAAPPGAGADLEVDIDKFNVATAFDVVYDWTLDKSVDDSELFLHVGDSQTVTYTVAVVRTLTSTFSITYDVTIVNKGPGTAEFGLGALIANPSGSIEYTSQFLENVTLAEGATFFKTYTTSFQINGLAANLDPLKISAVITELNNSLDDVKHGTSPAVNFADTPTGTYNSSLTVTDSFAGAGPWDFADSGSVTYQRTFTANALSTVVYDNTVTSNTLEKVLVPVLTDSASVSVTGVNSLPVADDKNINVTEGGSYSGSVTASDSDSDPLTFELVTGPLYESSFTFNSNGTFSYTHDGSENHSDSFTFKVSDGFGYSNIATVSITVDPVNDAPTANDDSFTVDEGNTHNGSVSATDPENDSLTFILVDGPLHGFLTFNADGTFTYEHDGSETTSDSFTFKVYDGALYSNTATVTITINPVNDAPVANDDSFTGDEGGTITDFVTGSDADGDTLTFILVSGPAYASSFTLNPDGTFTYVHDGSENHSDGFTFKVNDGSVDSNVATVVIALNAVNDAPDADDDSFTIDEGAVLNGNVTGSDPDGDSLTYVLVSGPDYYTSFILNPDGSFVYDHDGSETTQTTFTFKAYDGFLYSEEATITININPVNDAPVADDDSFTVAEGGTLNDFVTGSDAENDPLTFILVGDVSYGTLTLNADGTFTYVHDGSENHSDSFTFKVNDGEYDSNVATVNITVSPVNDAPTADDDSFTIDEGATENGNATGSDPDGDALTYILVDGPSFADYFEFNPDGSYTYTHDGSENFSDSFTFKVSDGLEESAVATITITINPVNDAPVADDDEFTLDEGATLNGNAFGSDAENDPLTFILVDDVQYGTLTLNPDGSFTYIHDGSENFSDSFTFKVNDGEYDSNVATITLTINPVNDAPVANDDGFAVNEGGTYDGTATGSDPDGDDLEFILVSDVVHGTLTFNADGTFTYIHDGSENFNDSFTFKVNDGTVDSNVATIDILINPVNEGPTAADSAFTVLEGGTHIGALIGFDVDGPILLFALVDDATEGTLVFNTDGTYTYTHDGGPATSDSFTFTVTDGQYTSGLYTVAITITQLNAAPISTPDAITVDEGGFVEDRVNGSDPDGDPIIYILVGDVTNGTLILNANGTYRYDHDGSETTADSFSYRVSDGRRLSAISVVTITINPVNEAPVAVDGELDTDFEEPVNGSLVNLISDVDSTAFAYILVTDVQNGTLTLNADGTFTYTPDAGFEGEDSFTFKANDGELDSNVATFTITVAEEVIIIDPETPQAPLNYWWLLMLLPLLLLLFLRPNLKYELVDAEGNKKTIRRHIFAKGDEDLFVDLNDKDMQNLVHVDLTVYKQLVKREQGRKITFNLFKKPMKTIEVPEDMKDAIKDRIEL